MTQADEPSGPSNAAGWKRKRQHWFRTRSQLNRLEQAIDTAQPRIQKRWRDLEEAPASAPLGVGENASSALSLSLGLLKSAHDALNQGFPDRGWAQLHAALESEVFAYDEFEVEALRTSLATEAAVGYLTGWQAKAVEGLLVELRVSNCHIGQQCGPDCPPAGHRFTSEARGILSHALQIRNDFFENLYVAIRVSAHRRVLLLAMGVVLLGAAAGLIIRQPDNVTIASNEKFVAASVAVAGMLGAVTSAIQRLAANPSSSIPAELDSLTATLTRPFIGAVGALTVLFAYQSGLLRLTASAPISLLLLASFGIGFTERLVVYSPQQQQQAR